jgi:hypothetical protein
MLAGALDLDGFFGTAEEKGNGHEIWYVERKESTYRADSLTTVAREVSDVWE